MEADVTTPEQGRALALEVLDRPLDERIGTDELANAETSSTDRGRPTPPTTHIHRYRE
jgi:hypothetical protein